MINNYWGIHKPRGHLRGKGSQMSILLHNPCYLVKVSSNEEGSKIPKICPCGLWTAPCKITRIVFFRTIENNVESNTNGIIFTIGR